MTSAAELGVCGLYQRSMWMSDRKKMETPKKSAKKCSTIFSDPQVSEQKKEQQISFFSLKMNKTSNCKLSLRPLCRPTSPRPADPRVCVDSCDSVRDAAEKCTYFHRERRCAASPAPLTMKICAFLSSVNGPRCCGGMATTRAGAASASFLHF